MDNSKELFIGIKKNKMVKHIHNANYAHLEKVVDPMAAGLGYVVLGNSIHRVERRF